MLKIELTKCEHFMKISSLKRICLYSSILFVLFTESQAQYSVNNIPKAYKQTNHYVFFNTNDKFNIFHPETGNLTEEIVLNSKVIIDSVFEIKNLGYTDEWYRWYFEYNAANQILSNKRLYYNTNNDYLQVTEIRIYNNAGKLTEIKRQEPIYLGLDYLEDSTIIDKYKKEFVYDKANLIQTIITYWSNYSESVLNEYYEYDASDKLIRIVKGDSETSDSENYFYKTDGQLYYILTASYAGSFSYSIEKHFYEETDTSLKTTYFSCGGLDQIPLVDTFSDWTCETEYYEIFDNQGRRSSITAKTSFSWNSKEIEHKAEFFYSESNKLLHATYYLWAGDINSGVWEESMKINNTYNENDDIIYYEKTFFDSYSEGWEIDESKTYYYSNVTGLYTQEKILFNDISIYPNPSSNTINLSEISTYNSEYAIYNLQGIIVKNGNLEKASINIHHLKPGIYFIKIFDGKAVQTGRFVKN